MRGRHGSPRTASTGRWSAAGSTCSATTCRPTRRPTGAASSTRTCSTRPRKLPFFIPLATVPMQSGKLAATILEEALDAGFHGAMIGTQPKGAAGVLDDPDLDPVLGSRVGAQGDAVRPSDLRGARRPAARLWAGQRGRPRDRHLDRDRAAALFRPPDALSGRQPGHLPWRRRAADDARPPAPELCDRAGGECRPGAGLPAALRRLGRLRCAHRALHRRHARARPRADGHRPAVRHRRRRADQADRCGRLLAGRARRDPRRHRGVAVSRAGRGEAHA